jgi:hypothetical protein
LTSTKRRSLVLSMLESTARGAAGQTIEHAPQIRRGAMYTACYALWFVTGALGAVNILVAWTGLQRLYVLLRLHPYGMAMVADFGLVIFAITWVIAIVWVEHVYREAVKTRKLPHRFATATLVQAALAAITALPILLRV